jgi:hypothetical protein
MQGFKCKVTGASPMAKPLAKAQAPIYCENDLEKCVKGAKQMLAWQQATGSNIETPQGATPNYNQKCGWMEGAQADIFDGNAAIIPTVAPPVSSSDSTSAIAKSVTVLPSTLATRVTSVSIAPTDVIQSISVSATNTVVHIESPTSCTARRPRYTV